MIKKCMQEFKTKRITPKENEYLISLNTKKLTSGLSLYEILKRPEVDISNLIKYLSEEYSNEVLEQISLEAKYEGYIRKALNEVHKMEKAEKKAQEKAAKLAKKAGKKNK